MFALYRNVDFVSSWIAQVCFQFVPAAGLRMSAPGLRGFPCHVRVDRMLIKSWKVMGLVHSACYSRLLATFRAEGCANTQSSVQSLKAWPDCSVSGLGR